MKMLSDNVTFNLTASHSDGCGTNGIESLEAIRERANVLSPHDLIKQKLEIRMPFRKGYRKLTTPKREIFQTEQNHPHFDTTR